MRPETIDAVERILELDATATEEERAAVGDALRGRLPGGVDTPVALPAKVAAARLGRTTARVRQLAAAGVLRRVYGGYDQESVMQLLRRGLPRPPAGSAPKRKPRRAGA